MFLHFLRCSSIFQNVLDLSGQGSCSYKLAASQELFITHLEAIQASRKKNLKKEGTSRQLQHLITQAEDMGKWGKYGKQYKKEWERDPVLASWIQAVPGDVTKAFCKQCKCEVRAHHADLQRHAETAKHKQNTSKVTSTRTLFDLGCSSKQVDNTSIKTAELKLAAHIACHSSIATVDHLGEIAKAISGKTIALHRTKCSALIKNVLSPVVHDELLEDLKDQSYSLIIDESTDIGMDKQLCVIVRYFSHKRSCIVTTFLGIIPLECGTAEGIFTALRQFLDKNRLPAERCIGLGTDGCNTMCGKNQSVMTKFQALCPRMIHIRCICHSVQLCSSYALKTLPRNIEFLVGETYNWFSHSTLRQQKYKQLYSCINIGEEPQKILKVSDTRWLSIAPCVQRILSQFEELKLHFQIVKDEERNYTAELLYQMYCCSENKLYLLFLKPILLELNRVNKLFQLDKGNPAHLLRELMTLYSTLLGKVFRPTTFATWSAVMDYDIENKDKTLPLSAVYFWSRVSAVCCREKLG